MCPLVAADDDCLTCEDPECVLSSWCYLGPALAVASIRGVNKQITDFLSLSLPCKRQVKLTSPKRLAFLLEMEIVAWGKHWQISEAATWHTCVPPCRAQLLLQNYFHFQPSAKSHLGRQQLMGQCFGSLPPTWDRVPGCCFGLLQPKLLTFREWINKSRISLHLSASQINEKRLRNIYRHVRKCINPENKSFMFITIRNIYLRIKLVN